MEQLSKLLAQNVVKPKRTVAERTKTADLMNRLKSEGLANKFFKRELENCVPLMDNDESRETDEGTHPASTVEEVDKIDFADARQWTQRKQKAS
jgi:hypothetical protein